MACVVCNKIYSPNDDKQIDSDEKPHQCPTCGLSFTFKIQLKRHIILHADGAPYTCKYCAKENENKGKTYNLRLGSKSEYTCEVCQKSFSNKRMLLRHSIQHTYDDGYEDGFEEKIKITIKKRVASHNSKSPSKKTSEREPVKLSLKRHWSSKSKTLTCDVCYKAFAYQACLDKHIKMGKCSSLSSSKPSPKHHSNDTIQKQGDKNLSNSGESENKINDISGKTDVKKHTCSICGKTFARKSSLDGHELSHILNKETSEDEEKYFSGSEMGEEEVPEPKKPRISTFKFQKSYTCDKCNFVCFSKQTLNKHMTNHKEKIDKGEVDKDMQNMKENCDSSSKENPFDSLESFKKDVCNISFKCDKCHKKFKNENKLLKHNCLKKDSTKMKEIKKNLICEVCSKTFTSRKDFKHHLSSHVEHNTDDSSLDKRDIFMKHHTKRSKNFACEICGRRFAGEICLRKHQLKHEDEAQSAETGTTPSSTTRVKKIKPVKELVCEYCNEEFTGKRSAYIKHIHAHTPEVCGICDERFIDRQSLREHCKIHVGTEEGRMFMQCSQKALDAKNGLIAPEPKVEYIYLVLR